MTDKSGVVCNRGHRAGRFLSGMVMPYIGEGSMTGRAFAATVSVLMVAAAPCAAQNPSLVPLGGEEAAQIVDGFLTALNRGAGEELESFLTPDARWGEYSYGEDRLNDQDWVPRFWHYALLQLGARSIPPSLGEIQDLRVTVVQRLSSGSTVVQREVWSGRPAGEDLTRRFEVLAAYKLRGGRIHRTWYLPGQDLDVPAGVHPRTTKCSPAIWFDAAHNNTSSADGLYSKPASVLRAAGYPVRVLVEAPFDRATLDTIAVLVIANALPDGFADARSDPDDPPPSAFTDAEMEALDSWVQGGGRLLLIADHDPWPAASADLASRFGARFRNGAAVDTTRPRGGGDLFTRSDGTLRPHPISDGAAPTERVDSVRTFLGQGFEVEGPLEPILVLHDGMKLASPGTLAAGPSAWTPAGGLAQAAAGRIGAGRVAILGEAWLFRFLGPSMQAGNTRFLINLFHWLTEGSCPA